MVLKNWLNKCYFEKKNSELTIKMLCYNTPIEILTHFLVYMLNKLTNNFKQNYIVFYIFCL